MRGAFFIYFSKERVNLSGQGRVILSRASSYLLRIAAITSAGRVGAGPEEGAVRRPLLPRGRHAGPGT